MWLCPQIAACGTRFDAAPLKCSDLGACARFASCIFNSKSNTCIKLCCRFEAETGGDLGMLDAADVEATIEAVKLKKVPGMFT